MQPFGLQKCESLAAGEVGYITASIKTVGDTKVGDTVTLADGGADEPLPGFRDVHPMVYSGIYPADGARYGDLRDALEKLRLNDASLVFEPEPRLRSDLDSDADSSAFFIWKSSRSVLSVNLILTL